MPELYPELYLSVFKTIINPIFLHLVDFLEQIAAVENYGCIGQLVIGRRMRRRCQFFSDR